MHEKFGKMIILLKKSFGQPQTRKRHVKTVHEGKKEYHCLIGNCEKSFGQRSHLQDHIAVVHDRIKSFKCPHNQCDKMFALKKDCRSHQKLIHSNSKPYKCDHCEASFAIPKAKNKHIKQCRPQKNRLVILV